MWYCLFTLPPPPPLIQTQNLLPRPVASKCSITFPASLSAGGLNVLCLCFPHNLWKVSYFYTPKRHSLICSTATRSRGLPRWLSGKESACQCRRCRKCGFGSWIRRIPWRRKWQLTPVFLLGEFLGQRSLGATVHGVAKSQTLWALMQSVAHTVWWYYMSPAWLPSPLQAVRLLTLESYFLPVLWAQAKLCLSLFPTHVPCLPPVFPWLGSRWFLWPQTEGELPSFPALSSWRLHHVL